MLFDHSPRLLTSVVPRAFTGHGSEIFNRPVHGEIKKFAVTVWVMSHFCVWRGAARACVDFYDPTAVSRLNSCDRKARQKKRANAWPSVFLLPNG